MMMGGSRSDSALVSGEVAHTNTTSRMLKSTASILSITFVMMMFWGSGSSNDYDSTATTLQRHLSSLQQFMDPKSTNLRSDVGGGGVTMNQQTTSTINNQHGDPKYQSPAMQTTHSL
jgi:hypothetical protein